MCLSASANAAEMPRKGSPLLYPYRTQCKRMAQNAEEDVQPTHTDAVAQDLHCIVHELGGTGGLGGEIAN